MQADTYADIVKALPCDPSVRSLLFFGLADDPDLERLQTGLLRADGSRRPSYAAVKWTLAATRGVCGGRAAAWAPATSVIGKHVNFTGKARAVVEGALLGVHHAGG